MIFILGAIFVIFTMTFGVLCVAFLGSVVSSIQALRASRWAEVSLDADWFDRFVSSFAGAR